MAQSINIKYLSSCIYLLPIVIISLSMLYLYIINLQRMAGVVTWAKGNRLFVELEDHQASHHHSHMCILRYLS